MLARTNMAFVYTVRYAEIILIVTPLCRGQPFLDSMLVKVFTE